MLSLRAFIKTQFDRRSAYLKTLYGSAENFAPNYLNNHGFAPYLETIRSQTLDMEAAEELAEAYIDHAQRTPGEIHQILAGICRQYGVELPIVEGILTPKFWNLTAVRKGWAVDEAPTAG